MFKPYLQSKLERLEPHPLTGPFLDDTIGLLPLGGSGYCLPKQGDGIGLVSDIGNL